MPGFQQRFLSMAPSAEPEVYTVWYLLMKGAIWGEPLIRNRYHGTLPSFVAGGGAAIPAIEDIRTIDRTDKVMNLLVLGSIHITFLLSYRSLRALHSVTQRQLRLVDR